MNTVLMFLILPAPAAVPDDVGPLADVEAFIAQREVCDHFLGEPTEGSSPPQVQRREFIRDSIDINCAGTDRRLAALKRRFAAEPSVIARLARFETPVEAACE